MLCYSDTVRIQIAKHKLFIRAPEGVFINNLHHILLAIFDLIVPLGQERGCYATHSSLGIASTPLRFGMLRKRREERPPPMTDALEDCFLFH